MRIVALMLAVLFIGTAEARKQEYWTCTDAAGNKTAQDFPCPEPLSENVAVPATQQLSEVPAQPDPVQQRAIPKSQSYLPQIDLVGGVLKPLAPTLLMFLVAALALAALKIWLAKKGAKAKVKKGSSITREEISRIEPSDELLRKSHPSTVEVPRPRQTHWSRDLIRRLEWKRFEELCQGYWQAKGYRAELTAIGPDGGVDVNLYAPSDPQKLFAIIQCKSWMDQVGVKEVRELWGVTSHLNVQMALFYGLSGFTEEAKAFASQKHLKLFSGDDLFAQILALTAEQQSALLDHVTRGDYSTPTCSRCDVKMVLIDGKKEGHKDSKFWGCVNFPKCRHTQHLRFSRPST